MPRNHEKFKYYKSGILQLEYAMHKKTGKITFEDGVHYTQQEINILNDLIIDDKITVDERKDIVRRMHDLKRIFTGTIVTDEKLKEIRNNPCNCVHTKSDGEE